MSTPAFDHDATCSPLLTQCPRCKNPHHACDQWREVPKPLCELTHIEALALVAQLEDEVATFRHGHRVASDNCVRLEQALAHMTANHADLVRRNAVLAERHDLPVDRLPAHRELVRLQTVLQTLETEEADSHALRERMAAQLHAIKVLAGPLSCWFGDLLVNYAQTNDCLSMPSAQVVLGGVDASVSAGDLRSLLAAISHVGKVTAASDELVALQVKYGMMKTTYEVELAQLRAAATDYDAMAAVIADFAFQLLGPDHKGKPFDMRQLCDLLRDQSARLKDIKEHTASFACWFGMQEAHASLVDKPAPDAAALFYFMGSGASTAVTHGEIRRMLNTIYGIKGMAS